MMEETWRLIRDAAPALAAACCCEPTGVQVGPLGAGDHGPHAGLGRHAGHGVHLWNDNVFSYNCPT